MILRFARLRDSHASPGHAPLPSPTVPTPRPPDPAQPLPSLSTEQIRNRLASQPAIPSVRARVDPEVLFRGVDFARRPVVPPYKHTQPVPRNFRQSTVDRLLGLYLAYYVEKGFLEAERPPLDAAKHPILLPSAIKAAMDHEQDLISINWSKEEYERACASIVARPETAIRALQQQQQQGKESDFLPS